MSKKQGNGAQKPDWMRFPGKRLFSKLSDWFLSGIVRSTKEMAVVQKQVRANSVTDPIFVLLALLTSTIATLGLISDSSTVIIGAMLMGPIMAPILGAALGYCTNNLKDILTALKTIGIGLAISLVLSTILSLLLYTLPYGTEIRYSDQLLAYSSPSLVAMLIALAAGSAAAFAVTNPRISSALPGAAVAMTLVPPICAAGIGISLFNPPIIFGAMLLFIINLAGVFIAGVLTFILLGFKPENQE